MEGAGMDARFISRLGHFLVLATLIYTIIGAF